MSLGVLKKAIKVLGPLLFLYILSKADFYQIWTAFTQADLVFILAGLLATVMLPMVRSYRWVLVNRGLGLWIKPGTAFKIQLIGNAAAFITPGRIGMELFRFQSLIKMGSAPQKAVQSIFFDRFFDILLQLAVFGGGVCFLMKDSDRLPPYIIPLLLVFIVIGCIIQFKTKGLNRLILFALPRKLRASIDSSLNFFSSQRKRILIISCQCLIFSLIVLAINAARIDFFLKALSIDVNFVYLTWCTTAIVIANYLPISFMGIGTRDATLIYFLAQKGIILEKSVYVSSLILFSLIVLSIVGILCYYLPAKIENKGIDLS